MSSGSGPNRPANRKPGTASGSGGEGLAGQLGRYAGFGLTIGLATALFAWLGTLLDEWLGTEPAFVLLGAFLGFGAGFYSMYWRLVLAADEEGEMPADRDAEPSSPDSGAPD